MPPLLASVDVRKNLTADICEEVGLTDLEPAEKTDFLDEMGAVVKERTEIRLWDELSDEQQLEMDALAESGSDRAALADSLAQAVPNYEEVIKDEIAVYKKELAERLSTLETLPAT